MFKVIIAGGRYFCIRKHWDTTNYDYISGSGAVYNKLKIDVAHGNIMRLLSNKCLNDVQIVSGGAIGADEVGEMFAEGNDMYCRPFPADWRNLDVPICKVKHNSHGAYNVLAGHNRNQEMANYADALIAFWDGKSTGTKDMINRATKEGLKVRVIRYE